MPSAFQKLYDLAKQSVNHPLEDYLTEVMAPIYKNPQILSNFFQKFSGINVKQIHNVRVWTQRTYTRLSNHHSDSKPDIVITFNDRKGKHIAFIENKLDSAEGFEQLTRYKDHLDLHRSQGYITHLFYITKWYDPKEKANYTQSDTHFHQLQWFQLYAWLKGLDENLYVNEVLIYMEEKELNKSRTFSPNDISALQNLQQLQSMLDDTLGGKVKEVFEQYFGKPMQWSNRANQLRHYNRYVLISDQSDWKFIGCGFWFTEDDYPEISVFLEATSNCKNKDALVKALQNFIIEHEGWILQEPADNNDELIFYLDKSLLEFLQGTDHIEDIQNYIVEQLEVLNLLKITIPELNWQSRGISVEV